MTYIKRITTSIDDRHCRGETTHRQNKLWQFIANIMIYIKNIYYTNIIRHIKKDIHVIYI